MACSQSVSSEQVIQRVTRQTQEVKGDEPIPDSFVLSPRMKRSNLRDATVSDTMTIVFFNRFEHFTDNNCLNYNNNIYIYIGNR